MKRKIAFVELFFHHEVLLNLCQLLALSKYEVHVFTTNAVCKSIGEEYEKEANYWFIKKEEESAPAFLERHQKELDQFDVVVFNTLAAHFSFFATFQLKAKTILLIHNAHTFLNPSKHRRLPFSFFDWPKGLLMILKKTILDSEVKHRKEVLAQMDFLSFPSEEVELAMKKLGYLGNYKTCSPLPFTFFEGRKENKFDEKITISITGTIDKLSKDYEQVYRALKKVKDELKNPIQLYLLGLPKGAYGKKIIRLFSTLKNLSIELRYFEKEVPQKDYEAILRKTDFVIVPLRKTSIYSIYEEHYGKSKISGGINDMIRFGLPALVVEHYPLNKDLQKITTPYADENELAENLLKWLNEKEFLKLDLKKAFESYSKEAVRKQLIKTLEKVIE